MTFQEFINAKEPILAQKRTILANLNDELSEIHIPNNANTKRMIVLYMEQEFNIKCISREETVRNNCVKEIKFVVDDLFLILFFLYQNEWEIRILRFEDVELDTNKAQEIGKKLIECFS